MTLQVEVDLYLQKRSSNRAFATALLNAFKANVDYYDALNRAEPEYRSLAVALAGEAEHALADRFNTLSESMHHEETIRSNIENLLLGRR